MNSSPVDIWDAHHQMKWAAKHGGALILNSDLSVLVMRQLAAAWVDLQEHPHKHHQPNSRPHNLPPCMPSKSPQQGHFTRCHHQHHQQQQLQLQLPFKPSLSSASVATSMSIIMWLRQQPCAVMIMDPSGS